MSQFITTINGVDIVTVDREGEIYVPIKPICQALSIDAKAQRRRIQEHFILSSVGVTMTSTGADGKQYEMLCLPLKFTYGWLFSIDLHLVSDSAREKLEQYQRECYEALYDHFTRAMKRTIETNEAEIAALRAVNDAILREKEARAERKKAEEALAAIRASRLDDTPQLF